MLTDIKVNPTMKTINTILKSKPVITALLLLLLTLAAQATLQQFSQPTYLTVTTNALLSSNVFAVTLPPISLTITATNANTRVTNTIFQCVTVTNSYTFVYDASTMGTSFTTNFNNGQPLTMYVTNTTYGQAAPQQGGSNTCFIQ